jgi:hypothetical protein
MSGKQNWYIPDAYLGSTGRGERFESHEAVCVLNHNSESVELNFTFYYEDREPIENVRVRIDGKRCKHIRLDSPDQLGGIVLLRDVPYAIVIEADRDVIVQYSRLDVTQPNYSLMTTIPYFE